MFLSKVSDFLQAIASLVNKMLSTTRKRQQMITSDGVLIIDGSLQTLSNGQIEVAFIARDTSGNVVMGSTVKQAITANETNLIQAVSNAILLFYCYSVHWLVFRWVQLV